MESVTPRFFASCRSLYFALAGTPRARQLEIALCVTPMALAKATVPPNFAITFCMRKNFHIR